MHCFHAIEKLLLRPKEAAGDSDSAAKKEIEDLVPKLVSDPIASLIHGVASGARRENEWVRLRGFSVHATKNDVMRFMEGVSVGEKNVKPNLDDVRCLAMHGCCSSFLQIAN